MHTTPCECGCGLSGQPQKMKTVRRTDGPPRIVGPQIFRNARSFRVLPACEQPFVDELRATERCRVTAELLTTLPRWRRLWKLPRHWQLRRLTLRRRLGDRAARRKAWGLIAATILNSTC